MTHPFTLGNTLRDKVTGMQGTALSVVYYLTGCTQMCISVPDKDGKHASEYFDIQRLEYVNEGLAAQFAPVDSGGPQRDAPTR